MLMSCYNMVTITVSSHDFRNLQTGCTFGDTWYRVGMEKHMSMFTKHTLARRSLSHRTTYRASASNFYPIKRNVL